MKNLSTKLLLLIVVLITIFIVTHPSVPDFVTKLFITEKTVVVQEGKKIRELSNTVANINTDMESATYTELLFPK